MSLSSRYFAPIGIHLGRDGVIPGAELGRSSFLPPAVNVGHKFVRFDPGPAGGHRFVHQFPATRFRAFRDGAVVFGIDPGGRRAPPGYFNRRRAVRRQHGDRDTALFDDDVFAIEGAQDFAQADAKFGGGHGAAWFAHNPSIFLDIHRFVKPDLRCSFEA
jgi:hypothetical protein